jgi:hypothetical protein
MERELLQLFLRSGPARQYNVRLFTAHARTTAPEAPEFLFRIPFLNECVIFKTVIADGYGRLSDRRPVRTLVYLPYDQVRPGDGGESFIFSSGDFSSFVQFKAGAGAFDEVTYEHDQRVLTILDTVPTLSPLVLELAFDRARTYIPPAYLDLPPDVRVKLMAFLKSRIRPLVVAAYDRSATNIDRAVEFMVNRLLMLDDVHAIMPLVRALRIPPLQASEVLSAWIGLTYFEYEYAALQNHLQEFSLWMADPSWQREPASLKERDFALSLIRFVQKRMHTDWQRIVLLSKRYQETYNGLVYDGEVKPFSEFLLECRSMYWEMGDVLGRFEQTTHVWRRYKNQLVGRGCSLRAITQFFSLLRLLHGPPPQLEQLTQQLAPPENGGFVALAADLF